VDYRKFFKTTTSHNYAGVSILAVGDLLQLNPARQSAVFTVPTGIRMKTECMFKIPSPLDGNHLYVGHLNIRSLNKHYCDIMSDPAFQQMAVICLTETRMKRTPKQTLLTNYKMVLDNKKHGLAIFVKQETCFSWNSFQNGRFVSREVVKMNGYRFLSAWRRA
jgi:hypothetical protein